MTGQEALQTSETYRWNTQTNGNWRMKTKGPRRSLWHVISEGDRLTCSI